MVNIFSLTTSIIKQSFIVFLKNKSKYWQFISYILAGSAATTVHYLILIFLVEIFVINLILASSIGFLAGACTGFYLNRCFVFCNLHAGKTACIKYFLLAGISAILNMSCLWALTKFTNIYYLLAQVITTISIMFCNFLCCKAWIFKNRDMGSKS